MRKFKIASVVSLVIILSGCSLGRFNRTVPADQKAGIGTSEEEKNPARNNIVDLSGRGLEKVPSDVFDKRDTTELNLSHNRLTGALPSQIGQLSKLVNLDVTDNLMTGIPAEIGQLRDLQIANFANNQITGLPMEIGNLTNLKVLVLTGNKYSQRDLDEIVKKLPNLVVITK